MKHNRHILRTLVLAAALFAAGQGAWAETVVYTLSGDTEQTGNVNFSATASGDATGTVNTSWAFTTATSISVSLPGSITFSFGTDKTGKGLASTGPLMIEGTTDTGGYITLSHTSKLIYHVALLGSNGAVIHENWNDSNSYTYRFPSIELMYIIVEYGDVIPIGGATLNGIADAYVYSGGGVFPIPEVVCFGRKLTWNEHYTVAYSHASQIGTAEVIITGISPYDGSVRQSYDLVDVIAVEWEAGIHEVTKDMVVETISMKGDVTLSIAKGETLTVNKGIILAEGAKLTVNGSGTLKVNNTREAAMAASGAYGATGEKGGTGYAGIKGDVIVNGCTLIVYGGQGGQGGQGGNAYPSNAGQGGPGGDGGAGIDGSLTVIIGTVTIQGGEGGKGGLPGILTNFQGGGMVDGEMFLHTGGGKGGDGGTGGVGITGSLAVTGGTVTVTGGGGGIPLFGFSGNGADGSPYKALGGTVSCTTPVHVIQDRDENGSWSTLASGSTTDKRYVRVVNNTPITLTGTLSDGMYWATFYHGSFRYSLPSGASAYTLGADHKLYRLGTDGRSIPVGVAVIILSDKPSIALTLDNGVTVITDHSGGNILSGSDSPVKVSGLSGSPYVLGIVNGKLGFYEYKGGPVPANKAYFVQ